ncbi:alpha/beta fold hydrolase [Longispora albida]|uniref:alpha/beta fold hydrolase n=1 Tax=Longispora albida TaxID=203523 RepID=UPI00039A76AC|nr:alpha/beta fold hydrolase [Longispora albida]
MDRIRLGTAAGGVLAVDAVLHLVWATGITWPASDTRALSHALLGTSGAPFTPRVLLTLAAILLTGAACVVAASRDRGGLIARLGALAVACGLLTRGLIGAGWAAGLGFGPGSAFYWLNLFVYVPLCLAAGIATLLVTRMPRWLAAFPAVLVVALLWGAYGWSPAEQRDHRPPADGQFAETALARFHYVRAGSGTPVVLLSPGAASTFAWRPQLDALRARHTVYIVDLPGQGFTELRARDFTWDLDGMTRAVGAFLDAMGIEKAALGGNSWSGGWALAYAQRYPARVTALALLAPSGLDEKDPPAWELMKYPIAGELMASAGAASRSSTASAVRGLFGHPELVTEAMVDEMWAPGTFTANRKSAYLLERGLDWRETQAALGRTSTPALILWGSGDTVLPVWQAARYRELMPSATVTVLDGCGHALTLDCAQPVASLMADFLHAH